MIVMEKNAKGELVPHIREQMYWPVLDAKGNLKHEPMGFYMRPASREEIDHEAAATS